MTAGLYSSNVNITILNDDPNWNASNKKEKTKIYFSDGIIPGGIQKIMVMGLSIMQKLGGIQIKKWMRQSFGMKYLTQSLQGAI